MTPDRRRLVIDEVRGTWKVSIRRTCAVLQAERSSYHYRSRRPDRAALRTKIKEIAETRVCSLPPKVSSRPVLRTGPVHNWFRSRAAACVMKRRSPRAP